MTQPDLFSGQHLRDVGMSKAIDNANRQNPNWSEIAYAFLLTYIAQNKEFMAEDVREASKLVVPCPPSKRSWGGIIVRAAKSGLISKLGTRNVKNPKAHCTPATVWGRV